MTETERRLRAIQEATERMKTDLDTAKELLAIVKDHVVNSIEPTSIYTPEETEVLLALSKLETILN